jgi:N-acetylglutamate synthase-like GNAT family acetyltransferase
MTSLGFSLRAAESADAPAIRQMVMRARLNPISLDWRRFLLAVDRAGGVIGCAQVRPHGDGSLELASVVVRESRRRRGVARALIGELQTAAGQPLWLTCRAPLMVFYRRFGFCEVGVDEPQPPYFRRVRRWLAAMGGLTGLDHPLAVMVWEAGTGSPGRRPRAHPGRA